ncbi:MAG: ABC transporter ATP-binding protein [Planctomycetota bacterium]
MVETPDTPTRPINPRYVEIVNLVKAYPNPTGDAIKVVDGFNLTVKEGDVIGVIGHSGCGKSTVLTMVAGLNEITSGDVVVDGKVVEGSGPDRAVVFQAPCLLPWMTAYQNVMLGVKRVYPQATRLERKQVVEYYINLVGLADSMHKYPREMSGGMQQRVGIARAIALKPKVLLLDEPFGRLDSLTRMDLQDVILGILAQEKITTMLITHDVDEAVFMSDRICMMTNGPHARVGQILDIPFERPRDRREVLAHDAYYDLRGCLIDFLEKFDKHKQPKTPDAPVPESTPSADTPIDSGKLEPVAAGAAATANGQAAPALVLTEV